MQLRAKLTLPRQALNFCHHSTPPSTRLLGQSSVLQAGPARKCHHPSTRVLLCWGIAPMQSGWLLLSGCLLAVGHPCHRKQCPVCMSPPFTPLPSDANACVPCLQWQESYRLQVMDSMLVSLSKFTAVLNPAALKPAVTFGENEKARMATETVFLLANRWGKLCCPCSERCMGLFCMQPLAHPSGHVCLMLLGVRLHHWHMFGLRRTYVTACKPGLNQAHAFETSGSGHCLAANIAPVAAKLLQRTDALPSAPLSSVLLLTPTRWAPQRLTASCWPVQVRGQPAQRVAQLHGLRHPHAQAQPAPRLGAAAGERQPRSGPSHPAACDKPHAQRQRLQHSLTGAQQVQSQTGCHTRFAGASRQPRQQARWRTRIPQLRLPSCHALTKWLELVLQCSMPSISAEKLSLCARSDVASLPFCSLISLEGADQGNQEASQRELRATQSTVECIEACRIDEIFADSKFLKAESLHELVKAIMWVSGPVMRIAATGEDSDVAEVGCR